MGAVDDYVKRVESGWEGGIVELQEAILADMREAHRQELEKHIDDLLSGKG